MKLTLDVQGLQTSGSRNRGIGRYTHDLMCALIQNATPEDQINLAWNTQLIDPTADIPTSILNNGGAEIFSAPYGVYARRAFSRDVHDMPRAINDALLRQAVGQSRSRHVLFSSLMETDETDFVLPQNLNFGPHINTYAIIYDIIPYIYRDAYLPGKPFLYKYLSHLKVLLSADILFSISEKTRQDMIELLGVEPDRIITIGTGVDLSHFSGIPTDEPIFRAQYELDKPFVFFLGGDEFRKNLPNMALAMAHLPAERRANLHLLVAGPVKEDVKEALRLQLLNNGFPGKIVFAGFMPQPHLLQAYKSCALTVIPSIYEGFGLPVLEAMACGATVVTSKNSSMSEILTDESLLFNPLDPADIAKTMEYALNNPEHIDRTKKTYASTIEKFNWSDVADKVLSTLKKIDGKQNKLHENPLNCKNIFLCGIPNKEALSFIEMASEKSNVTIYSDTPNNEEILYLPYSTRYYLEFDAGNSDDIPTICFVTDAKNLLIIRGIIDADHIVFIFTPDAWEQMLSIWLRPVHKMARSVRFWFSKAESIWVQTADNRLNLASPEGNILESVTENMTLVIASDISHIRLSSPYFVAKQLHAECNRFGQSPPARKLATLSAQTRFSRKRISAGLSTKVLPNP